MSTSPKPSAGATPPTPSKKRQSPSSSKESPSSSKESPSRKKQKTDDEGNKFDISLQDWLATEVGDPTIGRYPHSCFHSINVVKDEIKKPIRDLVSIFFDLCASQRCCDGRRTLVPGNLGMLRGNLVIRKLHTEVHTAAKCDENFRELRRFIKETFFRDSEIFLPQDMMQWLSLLKGACGCRELVNNHLALMNERARRNFIVQWSDIVPQLNRGQYQDYLHVCTKLPLFHDWEKKVTNIHAMESVLRKGKTKNSYQPHTQNNQTLFFRHFLEHFLDFCRRGPRQYRENLFFKYDDGLDILLSEFEESIAAFPLLLHKRRLLEIFKPGKFF